MLSVFGSAASGVLAWSLIEYLLHRLLGHDLRTRPNFFATEHTRHHAEGDYFAPAWKKALGACAAIPLIGALATSVAGETNGFVFGLSFVATYATYEIVHRRAHTHAGFGPYGRYLRRHHFHHHFSDPQTNHGVTSPLWDVVFGTWRRPATIRVPRKLAMRWLIDPNTGEVRPRFRSDFELIGRPTIH